MATPALTRQEKKERTRRALLEAGLAVFASRGYHGATVDEIAAEAGVTTGALYWHFASKEELFLALADEQVQQRLDEIRRVRAGDGQAGDVARQANEQFNGFLERNPDWPLLFFEFWAYAVRQPRLRKQFAVRRRAVQTALADSLERRLHELGVSASLPPEQIAIGIGALMNGLAFEAVADPRSVPDDLYGELLSRLLVGLVATASEGE